MTEESSPPPEQPVASDQILDPEDQPFEPDQIDPDRTLSSEFPPTPAKRAERLSLPATLREQGIELLRVTSQKLAQVADKLEAAQPTEAAAKATDTTPIWESVFPVLEQAWNRWRSILSNIRSRLPAAFNQRLSSDAALTGAIAATLMVVVWTSSSVLTSKPTTPTVAVAPPITAPTPEVLPPAERAVPSELTTPEAPPESAIAPAPAEEPLIPEPVPDEIPAAVPPPPVVLTPEQQLIASIQDQVVEVVNPYAEKLIQSIQPNFESSRLLVRVSRDWYTLKRSQQDNLAADLLQRARELTFSQLEITDTTGGLLARSPVVGDEMVIVKRRSTEAELG